MGRGGWTKVFTLNSTSKKLDEGICIESIGDIDKKGSVEQYFLSFDENVVNNMPENSNWSVTYDNCVFTISKNTMSVYKLKLDKLNIRTDPSCTSMTDFIREKIRNAFQQDIFYEMWVLKNTGRQDDYSQDLGYYVHDRIYLKKSSKRTGKRSLLWGDSPALLPRFQGKNEFKIVFVVNINNKYGPRITTMNLELVTCKDEECKNYLNASSFQRQISV